MMLANETYYSPGALFLQIDAHEPEFNDCTSRAGAILQNIAYALQNFEHEVPGGDLGIGYLKASKYLMRVKKALALTPQNLDSMELILEETKEKRVHEIFSTARFIKTLKEGGSYNKKPTTIFSKAKIYGERKKFSKKEIEKYFIPLGSSVIRACHKLTLKTQAKKISL